MTQSEQQVTERPDTSQQVRDKSVKFSRIAALVGITIGATELLVSTLNVFGGQFNENTMTLGFVVFGAIALIALLAAWVMMHATHQFDGHPARAVVTAAMIPVFVVVYSAATIWFWSYFNS